MKLRKATFEDLTELVAIGKTTFEETFASDNSSQNMRDYLNKSFTNDQIALELSNEFSEFFITTIEGQLVGYLKVNRNEAQTEQNLDHALEIERIYILKKYQGKKLGQQLLDKALDIAAQYQLRTIWLGVWEHNPKAIHFYEKNGFQIFDQHEFQLGDEVQIDLMMKLEL